MDGKRYNTLNNELKSIFGEKVMKLSLDGGFTCPNRDGTLGYKGCIFCGEEGSGEFSGSRFVSIKMQAEEQKNLLSKKWKSRKYIAYFQNFTNTYAPVKRLTEIYNQALDIDGVVGLAIATRPDCIDNEILDLLEDLNKRTFLWVELGLQTIHNKTSNFIRRKYSLEVYDNVIRQLGKRNIRVVTHLIIGLPYETKGDILQSVNYVASTNTWGIKIHSLFIQKDTDLYNYYLNNPFPILTKEEYVQLIVESLEILPKDMVIHRLTGDGKKDMLYLPKWSVDKLSILSSIDKELKNRDSFQGKCFKL